MDSRGSSLEPPFCQRWGRRVRESVPASQEVGQRPAVVERRHGAAVDESQRPAVAERRRAANLLRQAGPSVSRPRSEASTSPSSLAKATVAWLRRGAVVEAEAFFSPCQWTVPSSCRIGRGSGSAIFEAKYASACLVSSSSVLSFAMRSSMIFCRQFICKWPGVLQ